MSGGLRPLHFNAFKCAAVALRRAGGSCSAWRVLLERLKRGEGHMNTSGCPNEQTYDNKIGREDKTGSGQWGVRE